MNNTLITGNRLEAIRQLLQQIPKKGIIGEVGVYKGGSLKFIAQTLPDREVVGFDTFEGLPKEHWNEAEIHKPGEFSDTSLETVAQFLHDNENVKLVKGLFPDSGKDYEDKEFAFFHIDTDFGEAVKASLEWIWPRLLIGGIVVFDDYDWPNCPAVKKIVDEFPHARVRQLTHHQAFIVKLEQEYIPFEEIKNT